MIKFIAFDYNTHTQTNTQLNTIATYTHVMARKKVDSKCAAVLQQLQERRRARVRAQMKIAIHTNKFATQRRPALGSFPCDDCTCICACVCNCLIVSCTCVAVCVSLYISAIQGHLQARNSQIYWMTHRNMSTSTSENDCFCYKLCWYTMWRLKTRKTSYQYNKLIFSTIYNLTFFHYQQLRVHSTVVLSMTRI